MTKRLPAIALHAALIFIATLVYTHSAAAQLRDESGACGAQFSVCNNDLTSGEGITSTASVCRDSFGCLNCQASANMGTAVCARLYGASGFCTCTAIGMLYDSRFGRLMPRCSMTGSCAVR